MTMGPTNALPALLSLLLALLTCRLLSRHAGHDCAAGGVAAARYGPIDGLRGYLALGVFLSHGCLWYFYLRSGVWVVPPSHFYTHLGESGVALFFMITGFLFFSKLLEARDGRPLDWTRLWVSRCLRLAPAYGLAISLVFVIVAFRSHGALHESTPLLAKQVVEWLAFTMLGGPDINGVAQTAVIMSGVTWSLPYEWWFYLSLPLLSICLRLTPPVTCVVIGAACSLAFDWLRPNFYHVLAFGGGIAAAFAVRSPSLCRLASGRAASCVILTILGTVVAAWPGARSVPVLLLLSVAFVLIACGNDVFGLLRQPAALLLGEMAYSIYLLHGILLYVLFEYVLGAPAARLSPLAHWLTVVAITPVLVCASHAVFSFIEKPAMSRVSGVTVAVAAALTRIRRSPALVTDRGWSWPRRRRRWA